MVDLEIKINKIEKTCYELARREAKVLQEENDSVISEKKSELIDNYKDELAKKYIQDMEEIKKEYNNRVYNYEVQEKKKVNNLKSDLINKIKTEVESEINDFISSRFYKKYLTENISNTLKRLESNSDSEYIVFVTKRDFDKYGKALISKYNSVKLDKIEDEYLGGCRVLDSTNKVLIDNTLKNIIEEQIKLQYNN